jgi:hypothetical protein
MGHFTSKSTSKYLIKERNRKRELDRQKENSK